MKKAAVEYRIIRPDGEIRWISSRGRRRSGESGEPAGLMGVSLDITERKRTEEAQLRHSALVQSSDDAIISMDLQGMITDWNARCGKDLRVLRKRRRSDRRSSSLFPLNSRVKKERF